MSDLAASRLRLSTSRTRHAHSAIAIVAAKDDALSKNIIDALNDLNEHLPSAEDGYDW